MSDETAAPKLRMRLMPGSDEAIIAITGGGEVTKTAPEVENIIRGMIVMREMMSPAIPMADPAEGTPVITTERMRWNAQPNPHTPGTVNLALLHPGVGWIGISIPQDSAQDLAATILRCAQPAGSGRAN